MQTPVAFLVFNRPDQTKKVFEAIRKAKPEKLLVVADGPRKERSGEAEKCNAVRTVVEQIDWNCEVLRNYSEINLGCKRRVSTGIDWIFEQVEEAIILEDDCLPHPTFFSFCEELLGRYKDDERIMMISGTNYLNEWKPTVQSYHFSYYGGIWGWASWRRAWKYYDVAMKLWSEAEVKDRVRDILCDEAQYKARSEIFDKTFAGEIDTWDYQWSFARLSQSGLSIVPSVNLISNIGFGQDATHTTSNTVTLSNLLTSDLRLPLAFSQVVAVDRDYDRKLFERVSGKEPLLSKLNRKLVKIWR
jgi:hypothetical protein